MERNFRFFGASIQLRVVFALVASLLWFAMVESGYFSDATGAVFAALVLVPYLPGLQGILKLRALALLLCGMLSYWSATNFFMWVGDYAPRGILNFALPAAGVVGALIVGISARWLIPLAFRWRGWLMLVAAGCLGGVVLNIGLYAGFKLQNGVLNEYLLPGHVAWQLLVCLALYYGSASK